MYLVSVSLNSFTNLHIGRLGIYILHNKYPCQALPLSNITFIMTKMECMLFALNSSPGKS